MNDYILHVFLSNSGDKGDMKESFVKHWPWCSEHFCTFHLTEQNSTFLNLSKKFLFFPLLQFPQNRLFYFSFSKCNKNKYIYIYLLFFCQYSSMYGQMYSMWFHFCVMSSCAETWQGYWWVTWRKLAPTEGRGSLHLCPDTDNEERICLCGERSK